MRNVLVTGGAGFIGSNFVRYLQRMDSSVHIVNLDALTYAGSLESLKDLPDHERHTFVQGDICDRFLVENLLRRYRIDTVVNFAAESHVDRSIQGAAPFVRTNVVGTFTLLEAVCLVWLVEKGVPIKDARFHHISTDEVFGSLGPNDPPFSETSRYSPNSPYAASKASSDHLVRSYAHTYGVPVFITNCSNNYGPYQFPEKLIPLMILNAIEGRPLPVYGDGENVRDWLSVEDHCRAIQLVLEAGRHGETYNIGGGCERTNTQVVEAICAVVDQVLPGLPHAPCASLITFVEDRPGHDRRYAMDFSKIQQELGWKPLESFESGLTRTVRWYLHNSEWVERVQAGNYQRERLGLSGRR